MKPNQIPQKELLHWYRENHRPLPWRKGRDPYKIWISEIMLQQTTVTAVVPYYENFLSRFPNLEFLADAKLEEVLSAWSGLGYYSRARNLHAAAQELCKTGFPKSWEELIRFPGFGPYTSRAVSSFAFREKTGVLDGNVIRFLSRYHNQDLEWWKPRGRQTLQKYADLWAQHKNPDTINQALIEIGATVCLAKNPSCLICPVFKNCLARKKKCIDSLPRAKPKRAREIWLWTPKVTEKKNKLALVENNYAPFLKGHWIWPGETKQLRKAPSNFDFKHAVTHHDIYVNVETTKEIKNSKEVKWVLQKEIQKISPTSLVSKVLRYT